MSLYSCSSFLIVDIIVVIVIDSSFVEQIEKTSSIGIGILQMRASCGFNWEQGNQRTDTETETESSQSVNVTYN
jgi:hypothetical protein